MVEYFKSKTFLILLFSFSVILLVSPFIFKIPRIDQGNFEYVSAQLLEGKIPYRDVWEQKPPIIFFIDAIGLVIGHGSIWGIWIIELAGISISSLLCFHILQKYFSQKASFIGTCFFLYLLLFLLSFEGGNFTEEYILVFQFISVFLFLKIQRPVLLSFLLGLMTGVMFLTKQNFIGLNIVLIGFLIYKLFGFKKKLQCFITAVSGFSIVILSICIYLITNHAFYDFLTDTFLYNQIYSYSSMSDYSRGFLNTFASLTSTIIFPLICGVWIGEAIRFIKKRDLLISHQLVFIALMDFPIELIASNIAPRAYHHYYIPLIISMIILFTYLIEIFLSFRWTYKYFLLIPFFLLLSFSVGLIVFNLLANWTESTIQKNLLSNIQIQPDEDIFIWGGEGGLYSVLHKTSLTKYANLLPIFTVGYQTNQMVKEVSDAIDEKRPTVIIDTTQESGLIPPLGNLQKKTQMGNKYGVPVSITPFSLYFRKRYKLFEKNDLIGWSIYKKL